MAKVKNIGFLGVFFLLPFFLFGQNPTQTTASGIRPGIEQLPAHIGGLANKKVAVVTNHTAVFNDVHLVDYLISREVNITKVFAPEHGFRGTADAGEHVESGKDKTTGLPVVSLYGASKKPKPEQLQDVDVLIFDIQDVGVRFYTYISTLHYIMEAAAETGKTVWVLDRPNPNGFYVSGPVLKEKKYKSFVGMHPIPVVHGLTVGELAKMINGEKWLEGQLTCDLKVIEVEGYTHNDLYILPIAPSPNLKNMRAVYLYPGLGLFEGTVVSVGRGTDWPFEVFGHPDLQAGDFTFTPRPVPGATRPKLNGKLCRGYDLRHLNADFALETRKLYLTWLKTAYEHYSGSEPFFLKNNFFNLLAGNGRLQEQIKNRISLKEIEKSWQPDLDEYMEMRQKYLLYPDFTPSKGF